MAAEKLVDGHRPLAGRLDARRAPRRPGRRRSPGDCRPLRGSCPAQHPSAAGAFDHRHRTENQPNRRAVGTMPERVGLRPRLHRANLVLDRHGRTRPVDQAVGLFQPRGLAGQGRVLRQCLHAARLQQVDRLAHQPGAQARPAGPPARPPFRRGRWPRGPGRCTGRRRSAGSCGSRSRRFRSRRDRWPN